MELQFCVYFQIYYRGNAYNPGVNYSYSIWKQEKIRQVDYIWALGDWSQCSVTCGGGVKRRYPVCQETVSLDVTSELERPRVVEDSMCNVTLKPEHMMKSCNDNPCHYHWWIGPWQACSMTCSSKVGNLYISEVSST